MFPFRNILFPTDFSNHSKCALKYAAAFARDGNGSVVILNAQDAPVPANLLNLSEHELAAHENESLMHVRAGAQELLKDVIASLQTGIGALPQEHFEALRSKFFAELQQLENTVAS